MYLLIYLIPSLSGWRPHWVGFMCAFLPQQQQPHHCLLWLGQDCQGTLLALVSTEMGWIKVEPCPLIKKNGMYYLTFLMMNIVFDEGTTRIVYS